MKLGIDCVLRYRSFPQAAQLLGLLAATHPALAAAEACGEVMRENADHFNLPFGDGDIIHCPIASSRLNRLELDGVVASIEDADAWLSPLLADPRFIQARVYDKEYDFWQNAFDPLQYQSAGRSTAGLKMKSNGLPHPLTKDVVDTSSNPGRSELGNGFIESVGAVMWLGDGLWEALGKTVPNWFALPGLRVQSHRGSVRIQAADAAFTAADGAEGERQDALRALLFGPTPASHSHSAGTDCRGRTSS